MPEGTDTGQSLTTEQQSTGDARAFWTYWT